MKAMKEQVKTGELTAAEALEQAEKMAVKAPAVRESKTYKWLKRRAAKTNA